MPDTMEETLLLSSETTVTCVTIRQKLGIRCNNSGFMSRNCGCDFGEWPIHVEGCILYGRSDSRIFPSNHSAKKSLENTHSLNRKRS